MTRRWAWGLLLAAVVAGAAIAGVLAARDSEEAATATLRTLSADVSKAANSAAAFVAVPRQADVAVGGIVRTDARGFADLSYPDGSTSRIDADSLFSVRRLESDAGRRIVALNIGAGNALHRVEKVTGTETNRYEVTTPNAVAAVRGTEFTSGFDAAPEVSTFIVTSGLIEVASFDPATGRRGPGHLVGPGEKAIVGPDGVVVKTGQSPADQEAAQRLADGPGGRRGGGLRPAPGGDGASGGGADATQAQVEQYPPTSLAGGLGADITIGDGRRATAPAGSTLDVAAPGFDPGSPVAVELRSDPVRLADVTADDAGVARATVRIPVDTPAGTHSIAASGIGPDGRPREVASTLIVTSAPGPSGVGGLVAASGAAADEDDDSGWVPAMLLAVVATVVAAAVAVVLNRRRTAIVEDGVVIPTPSGTRR